MLLSRIGSSKGDRAAGVVGTNPVYLSMLEGEWRQLGKVR